MKWNFLYQITVASRTPVYEATTPRSPFSLSSVLNWICWTPPPEKIPGYATDKGWMDVVTVMQPMTIAKATVEARKWWISMMFLPRAGLDATKKEMLATSNLQLINITLTQMTDEYANW